MNVLITGAKGFIGAKPRIPIRNIQLGKAKNYNVSGELNVFEYDVDSDSGKLEVYCHDCDFVFNLAGVNRPQNKRSLCWVTLALPLRCSIP